MTMLIPLKCIKTYTFLLESAILSLLLICSTHLSAAPKVFNAVVDEDVILERVYEVRDISFTILSAESDDAFFESGVIRGVAGLDAVSGRMIIEISELSKSGMAMEAVGYVEDQDAAQGIPACTLWQTRMFEESKLCYAAEVKKGREFKIVISVDDDGAMPVASGQ